MKNNIELNIKKWFKEMTLYIIIYYNMPTVKLILIIQKL